jgi:hypothetical protein
MTTSVLRPRTKLAGVLVLAVAACSGGDPAVPDAAPSASIDAGSDAAPSDGSDAAPEVGHDAPEEPALGPFEYRTCDLATKVGEFRVQLDESYTAVSGAVADGVVPGDVPELSTQSGGCRLLKRRNLFCNPRCQSDTTCGTQGQCVPYPAGRSAGTVTITGLARPAVMMPSALGKRYDDSKLPHPGFQPGASILLRAAGEELRAFALRGVGVGPVALAAGEVVLEPGKDFELRWQAGAAGPARVHFELAIDQHGLTRAKLECDVPDEGVARVSAALIDELIAAGTSGFPRILVARRTVDATMVDTGCVELLVLAPVERTLKVPGHDPCRTDRDCPAGKTCALAIQTCR